MQFFSTIRISIAYFQLVFNRFVALFVFAFIFSTVATSVFADIGRDGVDSRITFTGAVGNDTSADGDSGLDASSPEAAFNSTDNQYLVVWDADEEVSNADEIYGAIFDGITGQQIGAEFRISQAGTNDSDTAFDAMEPTAVYNSQDNEYLVVWLADDDRDGLVNDEIEVFGQRLMADGSEIGSDFRISDMGDDGNIAFGPDNVSVAYNSADNEYLIVWESDDNSDLLVDGEREVFGQRLMADGSEIGSDFRITNTGTDGDSATNAQAPIVVYNNQDNQYLVVWYADNGIAPLVEGENEIYGQLLTSVAAPIGTAFRISDSGPDGDPDYDATFPDVAYNSFDNQYLVVWQGDDNVEGLVEGEDEAFGQLLDNNGNEIGNNDFRISNAGSDGDVNSDVDLPRVVHYRRPAEDDRALNHYFIVWQQDDNDVSNNEFEIFSQELKSDGSKLGGNVQISDQPTAFDDDVDQGEPALAFNIIEREVLILWHGERDILPLVQGKLEIYGERIFLDGPRAPIADAGSNQDVDPGALVTLDGSASFDANESDTLTYSWTQVSGPSVTLNEANTISPTFTAPVTGEPFETLVFELVVRDGTFDPMLLEREDSSQITIEVFDTPKIGSVFFASSSGSMGIFLLGLFLINIIRLVITRQN